MASDVPLGAAHKLGIECADCGRNRWIKPTQLVRGKITLHTPLSSVAPKLTCSTCVADGLPGKAVTVQVFFMRDADRELAEAEVFRSQQALSSGSRAKGS